MTQFLVPNLKEIVNNELIWKPGFIPTKNGYESRFLQQSSVPFDKKLLNKLGIKKGDKILAIAGNHGDWAKSIMDLGCTVDYNEFSVYFIKYVKKRIKFNKFIHGDFSLIPKKKLQYDWTFSFEPISGNKALPLAMLRSLLNKKGGILVYYNRLHQKGKAKRFPKIVRILSKVYGCDYEIKSLNINAIHNTGKKAKWKYHVFILRTNKKAREKAYTDLKTLNMLKNTKNYESLSRLDKISKLFKETFLIPISL